jgi:multisubunit Na+/H+ antiporter MnhC subunit
MFMRAFIAVIIIIAVAVGVFALVLPRDQLVRLIIFRDFFDVTLPILAFGALIKYLCMSHMNCKVFHEDK